MQPAKSFSLILTSTKKQKIVKIISACTESTHVLLKILNKYSSPGTFGLILSSTNTQKIVKIISACTENTYVLIKKHLIFVKNIHFDRPRVLIFSKIWKISEIWLCRCADCKVNCQTQPITVELITLTNLNAAISCT